MRSAPTPALLLALLTLWITESPCRAQPPADSFEAIQKLFTKVATASPNACEAPGPVDDDVSLAWSSVFDQAAKMVMESLNRAGTMSSLENATRTLKDLEALSNEADAAWPEEDRFHAQVLDIQQLAVVKMTFGVQARFYAFGMLKMAPEGGKGNRHWQRVGSDEVSVEHGTTRSWLDLYGLHRGPAGRARFLAAIGYTGCAGSSGLVYQVYEWNENNAVLQKAIDQAGSVGMDEVFDGHKPTAKDPFAPIGVLHTTGAAITLPYCWFSAIDYWDNPSLCAVDTYDLSGDAIRFKSRTYNRPELVSIAKALKYASEQDYQALLGYCASSGVARRMIHSTPILDFAEDPQTFRLKDGAERVEFGSPPSAVFNVAKRGNDWVIVSFKEE